MEDEIAILDGYQARVRVRSQPLAQIYSMRINVKEGVGDLRGKLKITAPGPTGWVDFCFPGESCYERKKKKPKVGDVRGSLEVTDGLLKSNIGVSCADEGRTKSAGGEWPVHARFTGPDRAISALGFFQIDLKFEDDYLEFENPNRVPNLDEVVLWSFFEDGDTYDKLQSATFSTRYGDVTMEYVVMKTAAEAYVEIFLRSDEAPAKIHGRIITQTTFGEIVLFEKDACEDIEIGPEDSIPLSRRVFAVPTGSELLICADVKEYNSDLSSYKDIVQGCAQLRPQILGTNSASIEGAAGEIEVKVTWLPFDADLSKGIEFFRSSLRNMKAFRAHFPPCAA